MKRIFSLAILLFAFDAQAASELKIGYLSTLSGPAGAIGGEIRDGFKLALKMAGGRLGGSGLLGRDPGIGRRLGLRPYAGEGDRPRAGPDDRTVAPRPRARRDAC